MIARLISAHCTSLIFSSLYPAKYANIASCMFKFPTD
ncbi:hypothetical protein NEOC65_000425 [Neochlamydia sp. AcF65]|nr:hypothetical protein [Neochlamydia sp. AcF65]